METKIASEFFHCKVCDYNTSRKDTYYKHLLTRKHKMEAAIAANAAEPAGYDISENIVIDNHLGFEEHIENTELDVYTCDKCNYSTARYDTFQRHLASQKHNKTNIELQLKCASCKKEFQSKSGLWKHVSKCERPKSDMDALLTYMGKKDEDFKTLIMELLKTTQINQSNSIVQNNNNNTLIQNNNCNNNNTTNNNNSFNLNFFLNETCKDAVNMSDFIKSIQVGFEDIERIGNIGYVDGISGIIIKSLQELGVEKRPIHCTDAKRQTLYIKENNEWTKEDPEWSHLQHMVDEVQKINLRQLPAWRDQHPNCLTSSSKYTTTYNTMSQELMGGDCKKVKMQVKDNKIMNKILKEVIIDKSLFLGDNK